MRKYLGFYLFFVCILAVSIWFVAPHDWLNFFVKWYVITVVMVAFLGVFIECITPRRKQSKSVYHGSFE